MSPFITYCLAVAMIAYAALLLLDLLRGRRIWLVLVQVALIALVAIALKLTVGFPVPQQAFGGPNPAVLVIAMLGCTVLGMAAERVFNSTARVEWMELVRPFVVSPIILLPLLGTILDSAAITTLQFVSFAFLAFQNGFFWKAVLDRARSNG